MPSPNYDPLHFLNPAPPILRNRVRCFIFHHDWVLYVFNHWTLQADLICFGCSRITTLSLASLTPEIQEVGSVEELIAAPNGPERIDPSDLHRLARFSPSLPEDDTVEEH